MSEYYCHRCEETIKLDRDIIYERGGLSNMAFWCYKDEIVKLKCFSEETLEEMIEIKKSGEKSHLVNWDYSDHWTKIAEDSTKIEIIETDEKQTSLNQAIVIGYLIFLPTIILFSVNALCNYFSKPVMQ